MSRAAWVEHCPAAITVCDREGTITEMNEKASRGFAKDGGKNLIGQSVIDCHPEPSRSKLLEIMATGNVNAYTIEKNGVKKLIYQCPWYENGEMAGLVEISLEIPFEMPHFIRAQS
jgi:transcriptional regulator with PAS, ATPase and Fis domain